MRRTPSSLGALLSLSLLAIGALLPRDASAHHVVSESGIAWVEPMSVAQVELSSSRFALGDHWRGRWWSLTPSLELRLFPRLSLMARAPLVRVDFDDGRGVMGLGDIEASAKGLLWSSPHGGLILSGGFGVELPTGSARDALGAGHVELTPFVAASTHPSERWVVNVMASERISLADHGAAEPTLVVTGSPLAVHEPHELLARATISYVHFTPLGFYATLGADQIVVWDDDPLTSGPLTGRAELGLSRANRWRLALRAELPLRGPHRHELLTSLNLATWL